MPVFIPDTYEEGSTFAVICGLHYMKQVCTHWRSWVMFLQLESWLNLAAFCASLIIARQLYSAE